MALELPLLAGLALGLSLAAPPGPVTALMVQATARRGAWRGFAVGLGATSADACFLLLALLGGIAVLAERPTLLGLASLAGAGLLACFALGAWRGARGAARSRGAPAGREGAQGSTEPGFAAGFAAAITSPFNLAWWIGPGSVLIASVGLSIVAGLFAGILAWILFLPHALAVLGRRLPRFQEGAGYASAAILAVFAAWVAWRGAAGLGAA